MDLISNHFIEVQYDEKSGIMTSTWKPSTEYASWKDIRTGFTDYFLKIIIEKGPRFVIVNESEMQRAYSPEEQIWVDENSATVVINSSVEKLAIVVSHDSFVKLATETMMGEVVSKDLNTQFFESIDDAKEWFSE